MFRLEHIGGSAIVCTKCSDWNIVEICSDWNILPVQYYAYQEIRTNCFKWNGLRELGGVEDGFAEWRKQLALCGGEC